MTEKTDVPAEHSRFRDVYGLIAPFLWPANEPMLRARVVTAVALMVGAKIINVQVPFIYKAVIDALTPVSGAAAATTIMALPLLALLAYGGARVGASIFNELRDAVFARVAQRAGRRMSMRVFEHLFRLSLDYHLQRRTGELSRLIERGVKAMTFLLGMVLFNLGPTIFEFALVIGILLWNYPWPFAAITFATIVGYAMFTIYATEWRTAFRREMNRRDNAVAANAVDSLINYETVKSFTNESFEARRLDGALEGYENAAVRSQTSLALLNLGQATIVALGVTAIMILAAQGVVNGTMTVGDVVLVNAFLLQLYQPLNILGFVYREVKQSLTDLENLSQLLNLQPKVLDAPNANPLVLQTGRVNFENVGFAYDPRRSIFEHFTLDVTPGTTVALVGGSGGGKSTLVRLLFRHYDVDSGRITIDGQDLRQITQASLRAALGLVPQDTVLFNDTIYANIAYGRIDADETEIFAAARKAQIHDFVERLPDGYQTLVGERGLKLSGGEKQRVAIARTVLKDPPILVLDEATSALDTVTERALQLAISNVVSGRTALVIAHRLSTIVNVDRIIVLEGGKVVESGTHQELLAAGGVYAGLWQQQEETTAP